MMSPALLQNAVDPHRLVAHDLDVQDNGVPFLSVNGQTVAVVNVLAELWLALPTLNRLAASSSGTHPTATHLGRRVARSSADQQRGDRRIKQESCRMRKSRPRAGDCVMRTVRESKTSWHTVRTNSA